ncbi:MAG: acyl-CoA dehydrogenase family protein [Polyangiaceae bacterium]|jgi:alkylation response protein AidB-like acyl-CoA dehydrogenase
MISFEPTEDQKMVRDSVAQFAQRTLRPRIREFEKTRSLPDDVLEAAHAMGLPLAAFPEAVGGAGLGVVTQVLIEEELAYGDPAAAFALSGPGAYGWAALHFGGPEVGKKLLAPFASEGAHARFGAVAWGERQVSRDRPGLVTIAERAGAGWKLRGEKSYVLHAERAESFVVFAQVDPAKGWDGLGAFVVPRDAKGLRVLPRLDTLGLDAASFGGIALDDVEVPDDARLSQGGDVKRLVAFFATQALFVAARAVGLSRAAFETTRDYCEQRKAFGKPIGHFQAVAFTLADRSMDLEAARAMIWRAAYHWDAAGHGADPAKSEPDVRASLQKIAWGVSFALEAAMRAGDDAVQLHGGSGFMRDYPVEKWMRDAKQLQLCAMTAEHADQLATLLALDRPLDPALVLPSAESQNVFL